MTPFLEPAALEYFRKLVLARLGLDFDDARRDYLADALHRRLLERSLPLSAYFAGLEDPADPDGEWRALASLLTVTETYFFRNQEQFQALAEVALPERLHARAGQRRLRLLSAGCASGEEPYSVAVIVRERVPELATWAIDIVGVDVNPTMLSRAARASYSAWALRQVPEVLRARYFHKRGRDFELDATIRAMVGFQERNLADAALPLWTGEPFDVIFCRNVVMYLAPECFRRLTALISRALVPGGYLFLGHAETLRGVSHAFRLCHSHETFYYQLKETPGGEPLVAYEPEPGLVPPDWRFSSSSSSQAQTDALAPDGRQARAGDWVGVIRTSSGRIAELTERVAPAPGGPPDQEPPAGERLDLTPTVALLETERFTEALDLVRTLPPAQADNPEVQLLHAVLLTNRGELEAGEQVCRRLLVADDLNASAHYVLALCREHRGDTTAAVRHSRASLYLDPDFAMPHVHLGLMARRQGDLETARRELGVALGLLPVEDPARILLFGGGFSRDALAELCRNELKACGGAP